MVRNLALVLLILSFNLRPAAAELVSAAPTELYDTHDARLFLQETVFGGRNEVLGFRNRIVRQQSVPTRVRVSVERQNDSFYLVFANQIGDDYPIYSRGSYIIKRSMVDGSFVQFKVFLQSDPGFFARVFPDGERSVMDLYLAGSRVYSGIVLPSSFEELLIAPFSQIVSQTRGLVRWDLVYPAVPTEGYGTVRSMVREVRRMLPSLPDAEDGAMDEHGRLVFIEDLVLQEGQPGFNCSGFAKWIADGLYFPRHRSYLPIDPLKEKHLGLRGHQWSNRLEGERDPYFGLDWTRNIARVLESGTGVDPAGLAHPEFADVRHVPFSRYVEDVGYPLEDLGRILYFLAIQEPGHFYLGSINTPFGSTPVLHQHVHVAVFFPYFDDEGRFQAVVMERNVETGVESLNRRYPGDHVHLVRIPASGAFQLPQIEYSR
ncbi:MAG: hypothetical protein ACLFPV_03255 [Spirochaetaceae bacterium]